MSEGFLSRWSRRKSGQEDQSVDPAKKEIQSPIVKEPESTIKNTETLPPPPTMEDVDKIDRYAPDFSAFMKPEVDPAVQQAALKKMFTDPHFNVMDGLDIYIDDYSKPDPLPPGMLQRMVQSDMLGLFQKTVNVADSTPKNKTSAISEAPSARPDILPNESNLQSDLTSTTSQALNESADLDEKQIARDQKKTSEGSP
jgi:hypothetical protein